MKKKLTQLMCLFLCVFVVFSCMGTSFVFAADEIELDEDTYFYTNDENPGSKDSELQKLFDLTLGDLSNSISALNWAFNTGTFTVLKKYNAVEEDNTVKTKYKVFVNVPNLQQYIQNMVLGFVPDGWDNEMFTPESNIRDSIGKLEYNDDGLVTKTPTNVLDKFGYSLSMPNYQGEYPRIFMSLTNIIPSGFFQSLWRGLKSLFGFSVIEAPGVTNFTTLFYYNNTYLDTRNEKLINYIQEIWIPLTKGVSGKDPWIKKGPLMHNGANFSTASGKEDHSSYFSGPEQVNEMAVTEDAKNAAETWITQHQEEVNEIEEKAIRRKEFEENSVSEYVYRQWDEEYAQAYKDYQSAQLLWEVTRENGGLPPGWKKETHTILNPAWIFDHTQPKTKTVVIYIDDKGKIHNSPPSITKPTKPNWEEYRDKKEEDYPALTEEEETLYNQYLKNLEIISNYENFIAWMDNGTQYQGHDYYTDGWFSSADRAATEFVTGLFGNDAGHPQWIYYSQCLLKTQKGDEDDENAKENNRRCIKYFNGKETSGTFYDFYVRSGLYSFETTNIGNNRISRLDAMAIISKLQKFFGPAYEEAMGNFILVTQLAAEHQGYDIKKYNDEDPRIMPYDVSTLKLEKDLEMMTVVDPRVEIYKGTNLVGGLITSFNINVFSFLNSGTFYELLISWAGKLTAISCTVDSWCNFDWLENLGLEPSSVWHIVSANVVITLLMIFLMLSIIGSCIKFIKGNEILKQVIGKTILFIVCLAFVYLFVNKSDSTYNLIKSKSEQIFTFAERLPISSEENLDELYGTEYESTVTYYIPYFNMWTYYMTGYELTAEQQVIDTSDGTSEVDKIKLPRYGDVTTGTETKLWPVVLADSFNSQGINEYSIDSFSGGINGGRTNNNAYRVVDHFLAPRITVDESAVPVLDDNTQLGKINDSITNTINENYNGKLQNPEILTGLGHLVAVVNVLIIAIIKFLTFLWFWYMLYTFIFNILLSATQISGNEMKSVLVKTFSPILYIVLIEFYVGIVVKLSMTTQGMWVLFINLLILVATSKLIEAWSNSPTFPTTLKPVKIIMHPILAITGFRARRAQQKYNIESQGSSYIEKDEDGNIKEDSILLDDGTFRYPSEERRNNAYRNKVISELRNNPSAYHEYSLKKKLFVDKEGLRDIARGGKPREKENQQENENDESNEENN